MIEDEQLRNIYKTASEEHLQKLESGLLHLEKQPQDQACLEELLREAHTLKGDSRMLGVKDVETLIHQMEEILIKVKQGEKALTSDLSDRLYRGIDAMSKLVREAVTGEAAGVSVFHVLAHLMGAPLPPTSESPKPARDATLPAEDRVPDEDSEDSTPEASPLLSDLDSPSAPPELGPELGPKLGKMALRETTLPEVTPVEASAATVEAVVHQPTAMSIRDSVATLAEEPTPTHQYRIETIRVEPQKLDVLMTQAGELTVTKIRIAHRLTEIEEIRTLYEEWSRDAFVNRFAFSGVERGQDSGALQQLQMLYHRTGERLDRLGNLISRLNSSAYEDTARLDIVAGELEEGIRTLRLLPLSTIFKLFPRMVRDLAKQQSKQIELVIEGGDTTADKQILEEMKDPLMHMIRNAIDHGIESPEEREQAGKPRTATIHLRGYQTATNIVIEVADDGRGLNLESIKRTALRSGVCREAELAAMSPEQIQALIFAPGFSTRTAVTEVSGRGVGLDVVRTNVERLKGIIQLESSPGMGCTFRVRVDTTLATTHVLIVEVNQIVYAIPVEFVQMTLLVAQQDLFAIEGSKTLLLNGQPISVAWLADLRELSFAPDATVSEKKKLPCIILQVGMERLGLIVDALLDEQNVVLKP
ncbi:MAG: chemotaxis protein CheA, partial [Leptolyngbyaceae bacterium]|nr:chemotaxis protein CheA [Leptolyngbyaceae bacterium]